MARTVRDATILLGALTREDKNDPAFARDGRKALADYTPFLDAESLTGKVIGVEK